MNISKSSSLPGHLMVLTTIIIYSFNTNFMKELMPQWISPYGLLLGRAIVSTIGFWILSLFWHSEEEVRPKLRDIGMMMLGGVLGIAGNLFFYLKGISMTGPVDTFVIRTFQPIIVIALSAFILHTGITFNKIVGIALGLAGTIYISITPHTHGVQDSFVGDMYVFLSSISYALFLVLIKPYTMKFSPITVIKWMSLSAMIVSFPIGIKDLLEAPALHENPGAMVWFEFGFILILATMLSYFLSIKALSYITPFTESAYIYLLPITGSIVSIALGIQAFSWHDPIALVLIVAGFWFINKPSVTRSPGAKFPQIHG